MYFEREIPIIGEDGFKIIKEKKVIVFGLGGVGGFCSEMLVRCGIKEITIVDYDIVCDSNVNRQIIATSKTIGRYKTDVLEERLKEINPDLIVKKHTIFVSDKNINDFNFNDYDYVCDCVDNVTAKLLIVQKAKAQNVKIISCMGTGNKSNPSLFKITNISKTKVCPLARVMRIELRKRKIEKLTVIYSDEKPIKSPLRNEIGKVIPSSIAFNPSVAGILIARYVILDLIKRKDK